MTEVEKLQYRIRVLETLVVELELQREIASAGVASAMGNHAKTNFLRWLDAESRVEAITKERDVLREAASGDQKSD